MPDKLGKLIPTLRSQCDAKGFFQTCADVCGRCELSDLAADCHNAALLLRHLQLHGAPISTTSRMTLSDVQNAVSYGCHSSTANNPSFVRTKLAEQICFGHVIVLPLRLVRDLWLSPASPKRAARTGSSTIFPSTA
mmetsp:Transcript_35617/g.65927  ORF Transcript_35617/g.65927 Transcript_35617/m.65927 type:complete len:136 (+) Transcript_35617:1696-2103(+)